MAKESDVRLIESLRIKIGEAKNLPNSAGHKETFCKVAFDQEQIFTTATVEKSINPFYGEEFQCEIPRKFRFLSFYVCEKSNRPDKTIGKVAVKKEDLQTYQGKDHWFPLQPVNALSEVQGKVHIEVKLDGSPDNNNLHKVNSAQQLVVRVLECKDLSINSGHCNAYATVSLVRVRSGKPKSDAKVKKTTVKRRTTSPTYNETFYFDLDKKGQNHDRNSPQVTDYVLSVSVWHDDSRVSREVRFLGEVRVPLKNLDPGLVHKAWYFLQPKGTGLRNRSSNMSLGALRVKIFYSADHVFSSQHYEKLKALLLKSPTAAPISSSVAYILGEVADMKEEAARPLVKVFYQRGQVQQLILALANWEITNTSDPNTIFRGNTLASKCVDELMKLVGLHYLHDTLKTIIDEIFDEKKSCEIDPARLKDGESLSANMHNLEAYVVRIFHAIVYSGLNCPTEMCEIFSALKDAASKCFPYKSEVRYQVLSCFVFLRFFAPAILGPKLFQLRTDMPDSTVPRTLTLISKTIQSIGNSVCAKTLAYGFKEEYMIPLIQKMTDQKHIDAIKNFLDIISCLTRMTQTTIEAPIVLKEGFLTKRAQGRRRFGLKNFKRRYFCLTNHCLTYAKDKGHVPLCEIPINHILAVEDLQEESFTRKYMFQVLQPTRALYIQADNCVEEEEWKHILKKVARMNNNRLRVYHPGAYLKGHWLCCKVEDASGAGCTPVSGALPADIKIEVDEDRELERISSLFSGNIDKLERLKALCSDRSEPSSEGQSTRGSGEISTVIEDPESFSATLDEILECLQSLRLRHKVYQQQLEEEMVPGSQEFPYGDGDYRKSVKTKL